MGKDFVKSLKILQIKNGKDDVSCYENYSFKIGSILSSS